MALKVKAVENHNDQLHGQRPTTLRKSPKVEGLSGFICIFAMFSHFYAYI